MKVVTRLRVLSLIAQFTTVGFFDSSYEQLPMLIVIFLLEKFNQPYLFPLLFTKL